MKKVLLDYIASHVCTRFYQTIDGNGNEKPEASWKLEHILFETFHRSNVAAYQAKDEISNMFNIYLLIGGIIAAGLPAVQDLIFRPETNPQFKIFLIVIAGVVLLLGGFLSAGFLGRFLHLANERYENIRIMNEIQNFYTRRSETDQQPDLAEILRIINAQQSSDRGKSVPPVIRYTVFMLGSAYFGGGIAVLQQWISPYLFIPVSSAVFIISFISFWLYYHKKS